MTCNRLNIGFAFFFIIQIICIGSLLFVNFSFSKDTIYQNKVSQMYILRETKSDLIINLYHQNLDILIERLNTTQQWLESEIDFGVYLLLFNEKQILLTHGIPIQLSLSDKISLEYYNYAHKKTIDINGTTIIIASKVLRFDNEKLVFAVIAKESELYKTINQMVQINILIISCLLFILLPIEFYFFNIFIVKYLKRQIRLVKELEHALDIAVSAIKLNTKNIE